MGCFSQTAHLHGTVIHYGVDHCSWTRFSSSMTLCSTILSFWTGSRTGELCLWARIRCSISQSLGLLAEQESRWPWTSTYYLPTAVDGHQLFGPCCPLRRKASKCLTWTGKAYCACASALVETGADYAASLVRTSAWEKIMSSISGESSRVIDILEGCRLYLY